MPPQYASTSSAGVVSVCPAVPTYSLSDPRHKFPVVKGIEDSSNTSYQYHLSANKELPINDRSCKMWWDLKAFKEDKQPVLYNWCTMYVLSCVWDDAYKEIACY